MTKYWTLILILPLLAVGCYQQEAKRNLEDAEAAQSKVIPAAKIVPVEEAMNTGTQTARPEPDVDARDVLQEAISAAKADDKALFVHFGADW